MKEIEVEGKTVTHAVEQGLSELGLRRDQVEVQVLEEGTPGFLGLGSKLAKVRIREKIWGEAHAEIVKPSEGTSAAARHARRPMETHRGSTAPRSPAPSYRPAGTREHRPAPTRERAPESAPIRSARTHVSARPAREQEGTPSPIHQAPPDINKACAETKVVLDELLHLLKIEHPNVIVNWDDKQVRVRAEIETPDTRVLMGKEGEGLEALQFLTTLTLSRRLKTPVAVQAECAGYWQEKEESVLLQVHQAMEMVKRTQRPVRLKPMDACLRRLVHRTLVNHPEFETASEGEGSWRKVVIKPKHKK